jgi:8-oxo-dGTP pyrophosphatase MutT (NUDIX family)
MKGKLYRAGLLPYVIEDGVVKFLFMKPADSRYGGDQFQIAKGKVEEGETSEQAALREASEELGLVVSNVGRPVFLGEFLGRTSFYVAPVADKRQFMEPHFETGETAWLTVSEYQNVGRLLHLPIVQDAARVVYLTTR